MKVTVKHKQSLMDVTVEKYGQIDNLVEVSNDNKKSISEVLETNEELIVNSENKGDQEIKDKITTQKLSFNNNSEFLVDLESVTIGNQTWSLRNWDFNYPGSKVYNNDESNRAIYGGLYSWDMVTSPDFAPNGWRVPTNQEYIDLLVALGGTPTSSIPAAIAAKEKGTEHWITDNGLNTSGFTALGGGLMTSGGSSINLKVVGNFWTKSEFSGTNGLYMNVNDTNPQMNVSINLAKGTFMSVRFIKE
jgi:uncharacterized protein (TIGR02145 family)